MKVFFQPVVGDSQNQNMNLLITHNRGTLKKVKSDGFPFKKLPGCVIFAIYASFSQL